MIGGSFLKILFAANVSPYGLTPFPARPCCPVRYAMIKVGKAVAFAIGVAFVAAQVSPVELSCSQLFFFGSVASKGPRRFDHRCSILCWSPKYSSQRWTGGCLTKISTVCRR